MKYVALLRGINVGGNKKVPMAELRAMVEEMGYSGVKTLLNSGNLVFESVQSEDDEVKDKLEAQIEATFGFSVPVILRRKEEVQSVVEKNPFRDIEVVKSTRLYVTFLPGVVRADVGLPYVAPSGGFKVLGRDEGEVYSVLDVEKTGTVDSMAYLEKTFGKGITTRNWNTVEKIAAL